MKTLEIVLNEEREVKLTAYLQEESLEYAELPKRPCIIVLPGGAYDYCSDREADVVALEYAAAGFNAFVLRYTISKFGKWPLPLEDYEQAINHIKQHAKEYNADENRIAVVGFSAGGHLAACTATMAKTKPAAAILGYAVTERETADFCQPDLPVPIDYIDYKTVPCFLFCARDDSIVSVLNTVNFEKKLAEFGIAFESHIYSYGGHGLTTGAKFINAAPLSDRVKNWLPDSIGWLEELWGKLNYNCYTEPKISKTLYSNGEEKYSLDCSFSYLFENIEVEKAVLKYYPKIKAQVADSKLHKIFDTWKLKDILNAFGYTDEKHKQLNDELQLIEKSK